MENIQIVENKLNAYLPLKKETKVTIPDNVEVIGYGAFANNKYIEEVIIPPSVKIIESRAFANCVNLKKITIPSTVKEVGEEAFIGCESAENLECDLKTKFWKDCFSLCKSLKKIKTPYDEARVIYFPAEDGFVICKYDHTTNEYIDVYTGRFASSMFPTMLPPKFSKLFYFAFINRHHKEYMWFSQDYEIAIKGVKFAAFDKTLYRHFHKIIDFNTVVNKFDFMLISGVCYEGIKDAMRILEYPDDVELPISKCLEICYHDAPGLLDRIEYSLNHQREETGIIDKDKMLSRKQLFSR